MNASLRPMALACGFFLWSAPCFSQQIAQPASAGTAPAAKSAIETIQRETVGLWIVEVAGETRTRTLNIQGAEGGTDGAWTLDATYGMTDGWQGPLKAQLRTVLDEYRLEFTTQPGTLVIAEGGGNGPLTGSFTPKGGNARQVRLVRTSADELKQLVASLKAARAALLAKPGTDVPESCARSFGGWTGRWQYEQGPPQRLWVLGLKADCTAQYSHRNTSSDAVPDSLLPTEIKGGTLTSRCGDGTCTFTTSGDTVFANYADPSGRWNRGVFQRIK